MGGDAPGRREGRAARGSPRASAAAGGGGRGKEGVRVTLIIALCWPAACVICDQLFISCTTYGSEGQR